MLPKAALATQRFLKDLAKISKSTYRNLVLSATTTDPGQGFKPDRDTGRIRPASTRMRTTTMKKIIVGGLAAVATAIGIATFPAGPAHADTVDTDAAAEATLAASQFTADVTNAGFYNQGGAGAQLVVGINVCNQLDAGWTPAQASDKLYAHSGLSAFGSGQFVGIAVRDLCPWHFGQGFYQSMPHGGSGSGTLA